MFLNYTKNHLKTPDCMYISLNMFVWFHKVSMRNLSSINHLLRHLFRQPQAGDGNAVIEPVSLSLSAQACELQK